MMAGALRKKENGAVFGKRLGFFAEEDEFFGEYDRKVMLQNLKNVD